MNNDGSFNKDEKRDTDTWILAADEVTKKKKSEVLRYQESLIITAHIEVNYRECLVAIFVSINCARIMTYMRGLSHNMDAMEKLQLV